jgi:histidinol dehydrogenase
MVLRLSTSQPDFEAQFSGLLDMKREQAEDVARDVADILKAVREQGDVAVRAYTAKFDRHEPAALSFSAQEIDAAYQACPASVREALEFAAARIRAYHSRQKPADDRYTDSTGVELGHRWTPVSAVGLYVPGGTAAYPSSVLMNAIPAHVAGVARIVMVVPTPDGHVNAQVLAAARIAGVSEIYRIGGAQAVGALAFGTASIAPVAKITGPGNAWVAEAKRQVFGRVGIDMIAGPSEVLILADGANDPDWIALDLLAQAEHDVSAQSILVTDDAGFADAVVEAVQRQLARLPRKAIAGESWRENGAVIVAGSLAQAVPLIDRLAPEHLQIVAAEAEALALQIQHAGAIFIGASTPEAVGDYVGGPNHVLPTSRSARFSSGLNVLDFMKRTSILKCSSDALAALGPAAITLARAEGLEAHARSIAIRLNLP